MAKEIAISKRLKISEAQQYTLLAVLGASLFLGAAIALISHFAKQISFNAGVISAQDQSIVSYSDAISSIGICQKPSGNVYTDEELRNCDPDSVNLSSIPNTLRSNILNNLAANSALNSVPKDGDSDCINPETGKNYTYKELTNFYNQASDSASVAEASQLIRSCSALRIIPDALPAYKNEEALLASLNKLFIISDWEPEGLSPSSTTPVSNFESSLNEISVNLSVEADSATTMRVLNNIERSIREFNIERATIEWSGESTLTLHASANAYYMTPSSLVESNKVFKENSSE